MQFNTDSNHIISNQENKVTQDEITENTWNEYFSKLNRMIIVRLAAGCELHSTCCIVGLPAVKACLFAHPSYILHLLGYLLLDINVTGFVEGIKVLSKWLLTFLFRKSGALYGPHFENLSK